MSVSPNRDLLRESRPETLAFPLPSINPLPPNAPRCCRQPLGRHSQSRYHEAANDFVSPKKFTAYRHVARFATLRVRIRLSPNSGSGLSRAPTMPDGINRPRRGISLEYARLSGILSRFTSVGLENLPLRTRHPRLNMKFVRLLLCLSVLSPSTALAQELVGSWCWLPGQGLEITFRIYIFEDGTTALHTSIEDALGDVASDSFALRPISRGYVRDDTGERYMITVSGDLAMYSGDELIARAAKGPC